MQAKAYKFAIIAVLFWSTVATAFKISLNYLTPTELVLLGASSFALFSVLSKKIHL